MPSPFPHHPPLTPPSVATADARKATASLPGTLAAIAAIAAITVSAAVAPMAAHAQLARKPSFYDARQPSQAFAPRPGASAAAPGTASPAATAASGTTAPVQATPASLPAISGRADFDRLARVYDAGTPMALPHLLFVIDRQTAPARIFYVNTPRFALHTRFVRETGLQPALPKREVDLNYLRPDRRFLFGTLSWQQNIAAFTYEFWEGDQLTPSLVAQTDAALKATFFAPVTFKSNSTLHERAAREAAAAGAPVALVTQEALIRQQPFLPLNPGQAFGRIRIVQNDAGLSRLTPDDIAVLSQVPLGLSPVAGVVTARASTALSHVNLLAKGWGVPNAYVQDAAAVFGAYDGRWVQLDVGAANYTVRPLTPDEIATVQARRQSPAAPLVALSPPDLRETRLLPLAGLRSRHSGQCGAKAATLGALAAARIPGTEVPDGFCIPFAHYARFMQANGLAARLAQMQAQPGFAGDPAVRAAALAQLRADITGWPVDAATAAGWQAQWQSQLGAAGVFVRSSSNSEDLPGFSGAGLYSTVPNVKAADALSRAVRTVWASVFNAEAWEARRAAGAAPDAVAMGVLVQRAVDPVNSGVMITRDPFDAKHPHITYISAKRGVGIRVVEGRRQAEQVMYSSWSKAIQVISRSDDDTALQLDPRGGVREVPQTVGRVVLDDALVLRLAAVAAAVKRQVGRGAVDQDIEWATVGEHGERIVLLQARPYVERRAAAPATVSAPTPLPPAATPPTPTPTLTPTPTPTPTR